MSAATIRRIDRAVIPRGTVALARYLLGKLLVREWRARIMVGRIVETEAYLIGDPASHGYGGMTRRNRSLFLDAGHAYVYLCYGTHYLLNVASARAGQGCGVLLRALEPVAGIPEPRTASGPGRLTAAFGVDLRHDGIDLFAGAPLWIGEDGCRANRVRRGARIGITRATEAKLRFFVAGSPSLSGPKRLNA